VKDWRIWVSFAAGTIAGLFVIFWWVNKSGWDPRWRLAYLGYDTTPDAFSEAAGRGDLRAVKRFVEAGLPLAGHEHYPRWSPINWAVINGKKDVVLFLLEEGRRAGIAKYGNDAFVLACYQGEDAVVDTMLEAGIPKDAQHESAGGNALFWAARTGQTKIVKKLAERGFDPLSKDFRGLAPRDAALKRNHGEVAAFLDTLPEVKAAAIPTPKAIPLSDEELAATQGMISSPPAPTQNDLDEGTPPSSSPKPDPASPSALAPEPATPPAVMESKPPAMEDPTAATGSSPAAKLPSDAAAAPSPGQAKPKNRPSRPSKRPLRPDRE
jgi:hypothetical protein